MRLLPLLCCAALCLPGRAVRGPGTVVGYIGGSLSVPCSYQKRYEKYPKYWCYPGTINSCSFKTHLVITSEQQPWAQRGRTSIWDNRTARVFTVTVRDLTAGDAGTYRCGVQTHLLQKDVADTVRVTVFPGPASRADIALPRITPELLPMGTDAPTGSPAPATYTAPGTDTAPDHRGSLPLFPLLAGLQVLALLATSAAVLWLNLWNGCTRPRPAAPHRFSPQ